MNLVDDMPAPVRARLQSSAFNLCAACIDDAVQHIARIRCRGARPRDYFAVITQMENQIRATEGSQS